MQHTDQLVKTLELPESIVGLRKDGIVHIHFKPGVEVTSEVQQQLLVTLNEFTGGIKHPLLYEAGENVTIDSESRATAKALEGKLPAICIAIYVQSLAHKLLAEFYYRFNKPQQRYKVFSDFGEAVKWLLETKRELEA